MIQMMRALGATAVVVASCMGSPAVAQTEQLTLCWAAWDPANALVELSKDFTAKTGIEMKYEFVPWTSYADRFLNELNSKGKLCDVIIGDSKWSGGFARPEIQAEFKKKYARELVPPKTWDELKQIAEFFQGREIDGKKVYGAYIYTERGSEGITMGVTNALYDWGFQYDDPKKPYHMEGFVNSPEAVKGLEFYKSLYKCCTAPGMSNAYMSEGLDAFKSGQVAMQMNFFAFFPGLYKDPNVGGDKIGFFVNPKEKFHFTQLGGQGISVVSYSEHRDDALAYIKWFAQPDVQKKWWALGGFSCHKAVLNDPGFAKSAPFAADFLKSMDIVKDFWAEPSYAELLLDMQKRVHDYVVADKGTAQQALDLLVKDWQKVFKEDGKI